MAELILEVKVKDKMNKGGIKHSNMDGESLLEVKNGALS